MPEIIKYPIIECIKKAEELGEDVAWSFTKITNDQHGCVPWGRGYGVTLYGATRDGKSITVFEKDKDLGTATDRAIRRYRERADA